MAMIALLFAIATTEAGDMEGSETFQQTFAGEKSGEPMLSLSSGDAAKYGKPTPEGYLFLLPKSNAAIPGAGLISQFRVRGDFQITVAYELVEIETPTAGYGSGATLFVVTASGDGAAVSRCDRPNEGPTFTTDRSLGLGTGRDKHEAMSSPTRAKAGKLQLIREGTTLRYLAAEGDGKIEELRREAFVAGDLTTVFLLADPGMATAALAVRFTEFSVTADELPLGSISEDKARHWLLAWLVGSFVLVGLTISGVMVSRKKKLALTTS